MASGTAALTIAEQCSGASNDTGRALERIAFTASVVEVFLMPDAAKKNYIELEVNPLGAMLDIYLLDIRKSLQFESWNSAELKWAVQLIGTADGNPGDDAWICEIAFPLKDAVTAPNLPPKPGDTWLFNLNRVEAKPTPMLLSL